MALGSINPVAPNTLSSETTIWQKNLNSNNIPHIN